MEPASQAQRFLCWELHPQRGFAQEGPAKAEVTSVSGISAFQAGKKERGLKTCGGVLFRSAKQLCSAEGQSRLGFGFGPCCRDDGEYGVSSAWDPVPPSVQRCRGASKGRAEICLNAAQMLKCCSNLPNCCSINTLEASAEKTDE